MSPEALDLFAGPGGWDEGARQIGLVDVDGLENDPHACATAEAAGHRRYQVDIAAAAPRDYAEPGLPLLIGSPPCPGFSPAGKGLGRKDFPLLTDAIAAMAAGIPAEAVLDVVRARQHDVRSALTLEPLRWVLALQPQAIALEQVANVLPLWQAYAPALEARGYSVVTGHLYAEQYGVAQTRKRAGLMATLDGEAALPTPTHSRYYSHNPAQLDEGVPRWVTMAEALGHGMTARPSCTVTGGGTATGGAEVFARGSRDGMAREEAAGRWLVGAGITGEGRPRAAAAAPAPTITGKGTAYWLDDPAAWRAVPAIEGERAEDITWPAERPSPTIVGTFAPDVVAAPGYRKAGDPPRQKTPGSVRITIAEASVRITIAEASVLQAFPADYPWQGGNGAQWQQVGNAVPPLLAAHVLSGLTGRALRQETAA